MEFIRFSSFDKSAARIFSESDILELELTLIMDPLAGDLIPVACASFAARWPDAVNAGAHA